MPVYDYLTVATTFCKDKYKDLEDYLWDKFKIANAKHDFYNLPFTPELITKFFKGWKLEVSNEHFQLFIYQKYDITIIDSENRYLINTRDTSSLKSTAYPIVLNDFIRDCIKEKIKLELK